MDALMNPNLGEALLSPARGSPIEPLPFDRPTQIEVSPEALSLKLVVTVSVKCGNEFRVC
jgi:hypothetical protein